MDKWLLKRPQPCQQKPPGTDNVQDSNKEDSQHEVVDEAIEIVNIAIDDSSSIAKPPAAKKMRSRGADGFQESWKRDYPWVR